MVEIACENPAGNGTFTIPDNSGHRVIGQSYYVYIDGYAGDLCDYFWEAHPGLPLIPQMIHVTMPLF